MLLVLILISAISAESTLCQFSDDYWKYANDQTCNLTKTANENDPVRSDNRFVKVGQCDNFYEYYSLCGSNDTTVRGFYCDYRWFISDSKIKKCGKKCGEKGLDSYNTCSGYGTLYYKGKNNIGGFIIFISVIGGCSEPFWFSRVVCCFVIK